MKTLNPQSFRLTIALITALFFTNFSMAQSPNFLMAGEGTQFESEGEVSKVIIDANYCDVSIFSMEQIPVVQAQASLGIIAEDQKFCNKFENAVTSKMSQNGKEVRISVNVNKESLKRLNGYDYLVGLYIAVPECVDIEITSQYCNVMATTETNNLTLDMEYGSLKTDLIAKNLIIKSNGTNIELSEINCNALFDVKYSDIYIDKQTGTLTANQSYSNITIRRGDNLVLNQRYSTTRVFGGVTNCVGKVDYSTVRLYMADGFKDVNMSGTMGNITVYGASSNGYLLDLTTRGVPANLNYRGVFDKGGAYINFKENVKNGEREKGMMGTPTKENPSKVTLDFKGLNMILGGYTPQEN